MRLGAFTANIIVDGKPLEEYDVVSESPTKVICWVASEEGKSFGVQWKCHEERRVTAAQGCVLVDGIGCGRVFSSSGILGVNDTKILTQYVHRTGTKDLMFARVQLSDDDSLLNNEIPKNLGEITLEIERGEIVRKHRPAGNRDCAVLGNNERLHERCKKATVHCVGFGQERARKVAPYRRHLIHDNQPKITFMFKYQPLSVLQANGIAPRPTLTNADVGSEHGSSKRGVGDPDDRTAEDIKPAQLNDRIRSLENELKRLCDLQANNSEDQKPERIKTEEPQERRRLLFTPGEIIDLT